MNIEQVAFPGFEAVAKKIVKPFRFESGPYEYKVQALRECPMQPEAQMLDTPDRCAEYLRKHIPAHPYFDRESECFVAVLLNTRRRVKGHYIVSVGTHDTVLVSPMAVFRIAVMTSAAAVILSHNHPSGDPSPSESDIKVTRDLIRAGQLLKIEVLDHVIMGNPTVERPKDWCSLRELGYFYN